MQNPYSNIDHLMQLLLRDPSLEASFSSPKVLHPKMERRVSPMPTLLFIAALMAASYFIISEAADSKGSFQDNFDIMWSQEHFSTSPDGQIWYLSLDKETGNTHIYTRLAILNSIFACFSLKI